MFCDFDWSRADACVGFLAGAAAYGVVGFGEEFVKFLIGFLTLFLDGAAAADLEMALEYRLTSVVVHFRNASVAPIAFAVGGRTGLGSMYSIAFTGSSAGGKACKVIDTTVGHVAGYLSPIILRIAAGSVASISIERKHLICLPSGGWSKLEATFTATAASNSWAGVPAGWTGTATSR